MCSASFQLNNNSPNSDSVDDERTGFIMLLLLIMAPFLGGIGFCGYGWQRRLVGMVLINKCPPA